MGQSDLAEAKQEILKVGRHVLRITSMRDGLFPIGDRSNLLLSSISKLIGSIERYMELESGPPVERPAVQDAEDFIIPDAIYRPSGDSPLLLLCLLQHVRERIAKEWDEYWKSVEDFYGMAKADEDGNLIEGHPANESLVSPDEPAAVLLVDESGQLEILLEHFELVSELPASGERQHSTESKVGTSEASARTDVPALQLALDASSLRTDLASRQTDTPFTSDPAQSRGLVWITTSRAMEIGRAMGIALQLPTLSKRKGEGCFETRSAEGRSRRVEIELGSFFRWLESGARGKTS
ncbi:hypothetical protein [Singulisphaera sp. PoT]|uniref:hypothetical protein n=1 Tax=Singulisphaera sp. PoT TaxID=3411797 RepID=UPI003BF4F71B